jgi:hypothetical protein
MLKVSSPTKRTFYIERIGREYRLVKVYEVGDQNAFADVRANLISRVFETEVSERIIAEQSVAIYRTPDGVKMEGDEQTVRTASRIAEDMLKGGKA